MQSDEEIAVFLVSKSKFRFVTAEYNFEDV